jgi:hypothetical protein
LVELLKEAHLKNEWHHQPGEDIILLDNGVKIGPK